MFDDGAQSQSPPELAYAATIHNPPWLVLVPAWRETR